MDAKNNLDILNERAKKKGIASLSPLEHAVWRHDRLTAANELAALREVVKKAHELVDDPRELTVRELSNALAKLEPK